MFALTALSAMDDYAAYEQLRDLLVVPSAETRYGAFRALWAMNPSDALVKGERWAGSSATTCSTTAGPPMIHVTRSRRPEIVLFGRDQRLLTPLAVNAGNEIMVTSTGADEITVSKFTVNEADQKRIVSTRSGRRDPRDRRTGRHLSRRGPGPAGGQGRRRAGHAGSRSTPCPRPGGRTIASRPASKTDQTAEAEIGLAEEGSRRQTAAFARKASHPVLTVAADEDHGENRLGR